MDEIAGMDDVGHTGELCKKTAESGDSLLWVKVTMLGLDGVQILHGKGYF